MTLIISNIAVLALVLLFIVGLIAVTINDVGTTFLSLIIAIGIIGIVEYYLKEKKKEQLPPPPP